MSLSFKIFIRADGTHHESELKWSNLIYKQTPAAREVTLVSPYATLITQSRQGVDSDRYLTERYRLSSDVLVSRRWNTVLRAAGGFEMGGGFSSGGGGLVRFTRSSDVGRWKYKIAVGFRRASEQQSYAAYSYGRTYISYWTASGN